MAYIDNFLRSLETLTLDYVLYVHRHEEWVDEYVMCILIREKYRHLQNEYNQRLINLIDRLNDEYEVLSLKLQEFNMSHDYEFTGHIEVDEVGFAKYNFERNYFNSGIYSEMEKLREKVNHLYLCQSRLFRKYDQ